MAVIDASDIKRRSTMQAAALVVMLERAGGTASYTEAEYQAIAERYGGTSNLAIRFEVLEDEGKPREAKLTLVRKKAENAELVM